MKIKPEERPTVIGLGVAIAAVLLFGAVRFLPDALRGDKTDSAPNGTGVTPNVPGSAGVTTGAVPGTPGTPGAMTTSRAIGSKVDMYNDTAVEPLTTRDPFTPAVLTPDMVVSSVPASTNFTRVPPPRAIVRTYPPPLIVTPFKPASPFPGRVTQSPSSLPSATDPNSQAGQVILAGVIAGPQAVAVIHIGDRAYPLTSGEKLPFDMSLTRITEEGVYVKQGKKTWFIQVGQSLSAAMSIKGGISDFKAPGSMAPMSQSGPIRRLTSLEMEQPVNTVQVGTPGTRGSADAVSARAQP